MKPPWFRVFVISVSVHRALMRQVGSVVLMPDEEGHKTTVFPVWRTEAKLTSGPDIFLLRFPRQPILLEPITEETNALVEMRNACLLAVEGESQRANEDRQAGSGYFCLFACSRHQQEVVS